jgi:lipoprotein-anchoring transpeptidase ErfK/SrfK
MSLRIFGVGGGVAGLAILMAAIAAVPVSAGAVAAPADTTERLRIEVVLSTREAHVYVDGERVATHDVAVGQEGHETPTGEWSIHRVDWNPDWTPPDSEWAEDSDHKEPGDPDNPMGRARLVFEPPYSIHGTEALESLGTAASHGSIRVANDVVIELGAMVMEYGGADRDRAWLEGVLDDPTTMREVPIPDPVPIVIRD